MRLVHGDLQGDTSVMAVIKHAATAIKIKIADFIAIRRMAAVVSVFHPLLLYVHTRSSFIALVQS